MFARTAAGSARSRSNGPPGAIRMTKNDTVTMTSRIGGSPASRLASWRATARSSLEADGLERVLVEDVRMPALDLPAQHPLVDVREERHDRRLVHDQDLLRLAQELHPLSRVRGAAAGLRDQLVIALAGPAGLVVAAARDPHVEEGVRVRVVPDPAGARDLVVEARLPGEVDLPLDVGQLDLDPELLLPHLLDRLRDHAVQLVRVVDQLDLREALAVREAGLGQELLRRRRVVRQPAHALVAAHP